MNYKLLIIFILLCLSNILNAQNDFRAGYIITNSNDTVFGEIDYRGDILMGKLCKFKTNGNIVDYLPSQISAYRFRTMENILFQKNLMVPKYFCSF